MDDIDAVINFDMPADNASYLHRIGRTGRAGKEGVAYSLVSITETDRLDHHDGGQSMKLLRCAWMRKAI